MRLLTALTLLVCALAHADDPLDRAREACERDVSACAKARELEAQERDRDAQALAADDRRRAAELAQQRAEQDAADALERANDDAVKRRCGKDYRALRVGMRLSRVLACGSSLTVRLEDLRGVVYDFEGGMVRVEAGKIVSVLWK